MRTIALCASLVFGLSVPALAEPAKASVASGVKSRIAQHMATTKSCEAQHVVIKVTAPPASGDVSTASESMVVPEVTSRGGPQGCVGRSVEGVAVYYQSRAGFKGEDHFRYQRTNEDNPKDRLNGEISYTVTVR